MSQPPQTLPNRASECQEAERRLAVNAISPFEDPYVGRDPRRPRGGRVTHQPVGAAGSNSRPAASLTIRWPTGSLRTTATTSMQASEPDRLRRLGTCAESVISSPSTTDRRFTVAGAYEHLQLRRRPAELHPCDPRRLRAAPGQQDRRPHGHRDPPGPHLVSIARRAGRAPVGGAGRLGIASWGSPVGRLRVVTVLADRLPPVSGSRSAIGSLMSRESRNLNGLSRVVTGSRPPGGASTR